MFLLHVSTSTSLSVGRYQKKKAHNCSGLCEIHTFVQLKHKFVTKFFNQLGNLFHNSKQYLMSHCRQSSMPILTTLVLREYTRVVWSVLMSRWTTGCCQIITNYRVRWFIVWSSRYCRLFHFFFLRHLLSVKCLSLRLNSRDISWYWRKSPSRAQWRFTSPTAYQRMGG